MKDIFGAEIHQGDWIAFNTGRINFVPNIAYVDSLTKSGKPRIKYYNSSKPVALNKKMCISGKWVTCKINFIKVIPTIEVKVNYEKK